MAPSSLRLAAVALVLALGCGSGAPAPGRAQGAGPAHAAKDHPHAAPHGGVVAAAGDKHVELVISAAGHADVYLLDADLKTLPPAGVSGKLRLTLEGGVKELGLFPHGDHLAAEGPALALSERYSCPMHPDVNQAAPGKCPLCGMELVKKTAEKRLTALADLTAAGAPLSARFEYTLGAPSGDAEEHQHDARHGGQLGMAGDNHLELVLAAPGEYRVFLSDARRAPLAPALAADAKLTVDPDAEAPEVLPLAPDPTGAFLAAKGAAKPATNLSVRVEMKLSGEPVLMDFLLSGAPAPHAH